MKISQERQGDILILVLRGRLTIGEGDSEVGQAMRSAAAAGEKKILIDMKDVPVIDSSGVGEVMAAYAGAKRRGCTIKLLWLSPRVGEVLKSTRLAGVFEIFDDRVDAIESFS